MGARLAYMRGSLTDYVTCASHQMGYFLPPLFRNINMSSSTPSATTSTTTHLWRKTSQSKHSILGKNSAVDRDRDCMGCAVLRLFLHLPDINASCSTSNRTPNFQRIIVLGCHVSLSCPRTPTQGPTNSPPSLLWKSARLASQMHKFNKIRMQSIGPVDG